ncbi:hypothetical protein EG817_002989 [Listeria monocytogenes]|nr:hypothetical protein [Listeria monocytogenes]
MTTIIKNGDKKAFLAMLLDYSKTQKKPAVSVFDEDLKDVQQFKTAAYAFLMGLSQLDQKSENNA